MVWVKASWLGETAPEIDEIPSIYSIRAALKDTRDNSLQLLHSAAEDMRELSRDLEALNVFWSYILKREPQEIWGPSILCFTPS